MPSTIKNKPFIFDNKLLSLIFNFNKKMNYIKKIGIHNVLVLLLCLVIIVIAEYLFLTGHELHGIFLGLWAPTILGIIIFLKLIDNGSK